MTGTGWQRRWMRILTTLLTAALMVMIFCFSMENAEQSDERSGFIADAVARIIRPDYSRMDAGSRQAYFDRLQLIIRKCAHFTEYTLLGFMFRLCLESWFGESVQKRRILTFAGFGGGTLYACSDEIHQLAIDGRYGTWTDVLVDAGGVLTGTLLARLLIAMLERKKKTVNSGR